MSDVEPVGGAPNDDDPINRLIVQLRAYIHQPTKSRGRRDRPWTSGFALVFDTETTTDPSQRLRFGAYQVRHNGTLLERGVFYAADLPADDLAVLRQTFAADHPTEAGETLKCRPLAEFIEEVFFAWGLDAGGLIVGFNLPFDISRLAIRHSYTRRRSAKGSDGHALAGGFSFSLSEDRPRVRVKHLSQRAAFINFGGKDGNDKNPDRGFFVDVKTLAAALTGQSHSLASLAKVLGTTRKMEMDDYDGPLTPQMVRYGVNDVQATWECFEVLARRYGAYGLKAGLHDLYSEASLGKAFLEGMNIKPWRQSQPDFPPHVIGQIMSAYYGGRSEVHIRREITPVIHCDFLSMYPTVCTLMGLWSFVTATGMQTHDATDEVRRFVETCCLSDLQKPETWQRLACIVQVLPDDDIFPVRAVYEKDQAATIGLNRLSASEPMWFTLADVLASKLLKGKTPQIVSATRFTPDGPQPALRDIDLAGAKVRPAKDDFYKLLIDLRRVIQAAEDAAAAEDKPALNSKQQGLKILANSTSYGIFVEINVKQLDRAKSVTCYDFTGVGRRMSASKVEEPGRYFHPLLGTLITGAARLMLALAERNALDQGLDWAFCDTDSLAIANTAGLADEEFIRRVRAVLAWFAPLNPYDVKGSILQLEKVNFPAGHHGDADKLRPLNCLAISAKRYVLFDRDEAGQPVVRKGSAHGLGHLLPPYKHPDPGDRSDRIKRIGVELWQEDLWKAVIAAHDAGEPDMVNYAGLMNADQPAASRYAATNQILLKWFEPYNLAVPSDDQVWPFNFLLSFQAKSAIEMAAVDPDALHLSAWRRRRPHPASRYSSDLANDQPPVFDRANGEAVPWHWLKTYGRSLVRHHLHSEMKFLSGYDADRGPLRRRHVHAWHVTSIGKEADNLEEREFLGEDDDAVQWPMGCTDRTRLIAEINTVQKEFGISDRALWIEAGVSHHTLANLRQGRRATEHSLLRLVQACEQLRTTAETNRSEHELWRLKALQLVDQTGSIAVVARCAGLSKSYLSRVLRKEKPMTEAIIEKIKKSGLINWRAE